MKDILDIIPSQHTLVGGWLDNECVAIEYQPNDSIWIWRAVSFGAPPDTDTYYFEPDAEAATAEFELVLSIEFYNGFYSWEAICHLTNQFINNDTWSQSFLCEDTETITEIICGRYEVLFK